jgi:hypothetical protein
MTGRPPVAYSHLPEILSKSRLKLTDLQRRLSEAGVHVNPKTLYRLTSTAPLQKIDTRVIGAICHACDVGIEDVIIFDQPRDEIQKLSGSAQKRLDELMSKHRENDLTKGEAKEFDDLCERAHTLTLANARLLASKRRSIPRTTRLPKTTRRRK